MSYQSPQLNQLGIPYHNSSMEGIGFLFFFLDRLVRKSQTSQSSDFIMCGLWPQTEVIKRSLEDFKYFRICWGLFNITFIKI